MCNSECEIERKVDSYQSCHVCDVWIRASTYILPIATMAFYIVPKSEPTKIFRTSLSCFQNFRITGMDSMPLAIGSSLVI